MLLSNQQWAENCTLLTMEKNLGVYCTFSSILWEDFSEYIFFVVFYCFRKTIAIMDKIIIEVL